MARAVILSGERRSTPGREAPILSPIPIAQEVLPIWFALPRRDDPDRQYHDIQARPESGGAQWRLNHHAREQRQAIGHDPSQRARGTQGPPDRDSEHDLVSRLAKLIGECAPTSESIHVGNHALVTKVIRSGNEHPLHAARA